MDKYGFVYLWRDRKHNRYYIGSHWGHEDDGYMCSSKTMREAYRRRPNDFKRRILSVIQTNRKDLLKKEQSWLDMIKSEEFGCRYYNINAKTHCYYWWMNEETKKQVGQKITSKNKGRLLTHTFWKKGNIPWNKGKHNCYSIETRSAMSQFRLGKTYEEIYGINKTSLIKQHQAQHRKGKTYEEIYGIEEAQQQRLIRSHPKTKSK